MLIEKLEWNVRANLYTLFDWKSICQIKIDERLFLPLVEWHTYHWEVDEIEKSVAGRCTKLKCEMKMTTTICTHTHKTLTHTKLAHFFPLNVPPSLSTRSFSSYLLLWDSGTHIHSAAPCPPLTNKFGHSIFHSTLHSIPNSQPPSRPHKSNELLRLTA